MKLYGAVTQQSDGGKAILGKDGTIWQTPEVKDFPVGMPVEFTIVSYEIEVVAEVYVRTDLDLFSDLGRTSLATMMPDKLALVQVRVAPTSEFETRLALVYANDRNTEVTDQVALQMLVDKLRAPEKPVIEICQQTMNPGHYGARLASDHGIQEDALGINSVILKILVSLGSQGMSDKQEDYTYVFLPSRSF